MRNIKVSYIKYKIRIAILCWIISLFNLVQCIQLDTTQWQEVDITNDFITQNFIQVSGYSRYYDSLQLSQTKYVNLIRNSDYSFGEILIQVLDEQGNQQCSKTISVVGYLKYSLTSTNVEEEFFLAYTSIVGSNFNVFFGFLDETCNFSRGLSAPVQPSGFSSTKFVHIQAKTGNQNVYVVMQIRYSPFDLYLMILDISDTSTYGIKKHVKLGTSNFRENLFSIQAFFDDYAVIFTRNTSDQLLKIIIDSDGNETWDTLKDQGIFLDLINNVNHIQNKAIQIQNTNKYSIVTGDREQDIFTIYTFQYNGDGEIQDICLKTYLNQMGNVGIEFFFALEFEVINQDFVWIKGDKNQLNKKTVIFFANPQDCQVYRNQGDKNCPRYCSTCINFENCDSCVSANVLRNVSNQCICPDKYFQDQSSNDCLSCPQYCEVCSDSSTCQSCISSDGEQDIFNQCKCKDGYYQDTISGNCLECPQYCNVCSDSYTCQSCISSDGEREVSNLCNCKDGYYQDTISDNCLECPYYCEICSDSYTCQSCIPPNGERDVSNLCNCKDGYYQDTISDNCLECPLYCSTCSDSTTCHTCIGPDGERDTSSQCKCKQGQYLDIENDNCLECPQYCESCSENGKCQKCIVTTGLRDLMQQNQNQICARIRRGFKMQRKLFFA
ncbi:Insulin-like growth factor binding protein, N-terminal [Pseudocohnilembus persalinus]|uniref:Insulin-like growth factor binding protein, N-terminal n=1 Tax=Pseudocohnilembus persalinus TaxID=266149 RepID=A0A0V0R627_PSEPJ|nr:Insulin-like growth factor binding protein, N-terminal [Pseudocohnilembus persalinus]|eukprot:KRX09953.1 Insulin-like growth factor binding protein, N-terminal [Pseudocohnilembus persalinus]